jgi:hypothetical protein
VETLSNGMAPRLARPGGSETTRRGSKERTLRDELNRLYRWTFDAFKIRGRGCDGR